MGHRRFDRDTWSDGCVVVVAYGLLAYLAGCAVVLYWVTEAVIRWAFRR
jgi:hypothetical protein